MMYDLIGDTHGCAQTLAALLETLGYQHDGNCYRHPSNQVIFLGDFIDRGPFQRETIDIAMTMVQHGTALAVMGNHEFNALAYATEDPAAPGSYLRQHDDKNNKQHKAFLAAFADDLEGKAKALAWFRTLPLWLDLGELRVVHACWHPGYMAYLQEQNLLGSNNTLTEKLLLEGSRKGSEAYEAVETLLKGKEVRLPEGLHFFDKEKTKRHHVRIKWWQRDGTYRTSAFTGDDRATHIPEDPIDAAHFVTYQHDAPPVFLGHYWLKGSPQPMAPNVACLDYSVAKKGQLVAYRWQGEQTLDAGHFCTVNRVEPPDPEKSNP